MNLPGTVSERGEWAKVMKVFCVFHSIVIVLSLFYFEKLFMYAKELMTMCPILLFDLIIDESLTPQSNLATLCRLASRYLVSTSNSSERSWSWAVLSAVGGLSVAVVA